MSQCVPSWDLDNSAPPPKPSYVHHAHSNSANSLPFHVPSLDFEQVAELTWENGQLAMHGLAAARVGTTKPSAVAVPPSIKYPAWEKPRAGGTLESIVNQATTHKAHVNELVPWFDHHHHHRAVADALVPCSNNNKSNNNIQYKKNNIENQESSGGHVPRCSALVGSCSGAGSAVDGGRGGACKCGGASESASRQVTVDNSEREFGGGGGPTSTSLWSPENTSSAGASVEEHDSVCHARSQRDDRKKKATGKSSASTKSRAAAIHNQSERKRRDKINQRMKTLQKMVPNSSKTDKASMLDEVIEYLKQLQAQVHMMSRMNMPSMMMPLAMQQHQLHHQMSMMTSMGMGVMDMGRMPPAAAGAFVPMPPPSWDIQGVGNHSLAPDLLPAFLACQSQPNPMTMDAYSRVAALYQQFQQPPASGPKN